MSTTDLLPLTSDLSTIKNILVIKPKVLGDVMMATPVVKNLHQRLPHARISFLVEKPYAEIFHGNPHVHEVVEFDREQSAGWKFWRMLRSKRFDLVMDLWCTSRTVAWTLATGAPWRVGFNHRGRRWAYNIRVHSNETYAADINLDCVRVLGLEAKDHKPEIFLSTDETRWAEETLRRLGRTKDAKLIMLAPGAGWSSKRWPTESFGRLGNMLAERSGGQIVLLCGPQDDEAVHDVINRMRVRSLVIRGTTLRQTASLIQRMDLYIGNDSGPIQFAVALDVPTITLLGPTNSDCIAPFGRNAELRHHVACSPCQLRACPLPVHLCMEGIEVDAVIEQAKKVLGK